MTTDWLPDCHDCRTDPAVAVVVDDKYGFRYERCASCGEALVRVLSTKHPESVFHVETQRLAAVAA